MSFSETMQTERSKRKWYGERLASLRTDYDNWSIPLREVASKHGTSLGRISQLAREHDFKPRMGRRTDMRLVAIRARISSLKFRMKRDEEELKRLEELAAG